MVFRNLLRRRTRTLLTLTGIAIGIAAIVALVALSQGIAANYAEATGRSDAHVTLQAVQEAGQAITIATGFDEALADRIRAMSEVKSVDGMVFTMVSMPSTPFFILYGYDPDGLGIRHFKVYEGSTLAEHRTRRGGRPILLGKVAANNLKKGIGDTVRIEETTFRIVGIYETGTSLEDAGGVVSLKDAQILADMPRQVVYMGIQLHRPDRVEAFEAKLARMLPPDVEIAGTQLGNMMLEMLGMLDVFAWAVALVAAAVGGVGMMNTMLMSVFERTREIGVLRAVGWRRRQVLAMVLAESLILSFIGGAVGLGLGVGLTWLASQAPAMAGLTAGTVPPNLILQSMSAALVLGMTGGLYPAWRASRLAPIEALSYEGSASRSQHLRIPFGGMAVQSLSRQRTRTALTLLGVGIGVVAILLIGSAVEGAVQGFDGMVSGAEISGVEANQPDTSLSSIDERTMRRIAALPEVQHVSGLLMSVVATSSEPFFVITARSRSDPILQGLVVREGRLLTARRECLLGWKAAAQQKKGLGDRFSMLGSSFTVVGIVETGNAIEDNGAIIDLREAQTLLKKPRQVMLVDVKLVDPETTDAVLAKLEAQYPKLLFSRSSEFTESLPDMQVSRDMLQFIYVMTVVVGSVALMNTMIMSVYERTREIGVLRAVGWRKGMVLRQMLSEALLLTVISGGVGILVSLGLIRVFRRMPQMGLYRDLFVLSPSLMIQALVFSAVLGVVAGLYPAWQATRFSPIEALRYE